MKRKLFDCNKDQVHEFKRTMRLTEKATSLTSSEAIQDQKKLIFQETLR